MAPSERTSPPGSATATAIFSESTSSPTCRISFFIGRLLSLVALRYGQPIASVTYGLAMGAGRPILTSPPSRRAPASRRRGAGRRSPDAGAHPIGWTRSRDGKRRKGTCPDAPPVQTPHPPFARGYEGRFSPVALPPAGRLVWRSSVGSTGRGGLGTPRFSVLLSGTSRSFFPLTMSEF